jgi:hypothetical protein
MPVRIVGGGRHILWTGWLIARNVLTTERTRWTASPALYEEQAANQQTNEDCRIHHNPHETTEMPSRHRVLIHAGPFDAQVQATIENATGLRNGRQRAAMKSVDFG